MMKNFRIQERKNIQFRFESYNALNHPNFMLPNNQFNQATAGLITERGGHGARRPARVSGEDEI